MASPTLKTDIIISIRQPFLDQIASFKKNHEFRGYLLPAVVKRFWIYEPSPVSAVRYVAEVSNGKRPGEVEEGGIVRNAEFNKGLYAVGCFAYEIIKLEELASPVTLAELKSKGWLGGAPQKYCYLKSSMARSVRNARTTAVSAHSPPILSSISLEWEQEGCDGETTGILMSLGCVPSLIGYDRRVPFSFKTFLHCEEAYYSVGWHS